MSDPDGKITITVNDVEHEVGRHPTLIGALHEIGCETPYFCYHAGLEPDGNCRICYVNLADPRSGDCSPRLFTSCTTPLTDGMTVWTDTEAVIEGRKAVMEFLLVNHPLDCPVCDKSGECDLQDFTFLHGRSAARTVDERNKFPVRDLGATLKIWNTRCIVCKRCVRFLNEVTGTGELTVIHRSDKAEIATFPGIPVDNPLMGNLVDICPVGAIIDKDFLFQARVWYLEKCDTISPDSALGCNIVLEHIQGEAKRIRPRRNDEVNGHWIADEERYNYRYLNDIERLSAARVDGRIVPLAVAVEAAAARLQEHAGAGKAAALTSAFATLEELELFRQLVEALGIDAPLSYLARPVVEDVAFPGWTIHGDKNPNRAGVELIFGEDCTEENLDRILRRIREGKVRALFVHGGVPQRGTVPYQVPKKLVNVLDQLDLLVVLDMLPGPLTEIAEIVLPGATYAEKSGVWINNQGRVQLLNKAFECPGKAQEDATILQMLLREIAGEGAVRSAAEVFADLAERKPALGGMTHWKIRRGGKRLQSAHAETA